MKIITIFFLLYEFSFYDLLEGKYKMVKYHGKEECYVDNVRICGDFNLNSLKQACISVRVPVSIFLI